MFLYENNKCPVCGKEFVEGDDVVACPECGTPHHRDCYKSTGHCANKNLHGTDFVYDRNHGVNDKKTRDSQPFYYQQIEDEIKKIAETAELSATVENAAESENAESAAETQQQAEVKASEEMIDGVSVSDVETVIGVNSDKFIRKFSKKSKLGWNWGAFFFGPYYFMFRKMYTESIVFLILPMAISFVIRTVFSSAMLVLNNIAAEMSKYLASYDVEKMSAYLKESFAAPENRNAWLAILISFASTVLLSVIAAVIANNQYRKKVVKVVKVVDEKVDMGESFSLINPMLGGENMSQSDLRKMFLAKQGGVSMLWPCIFIALTFFSYMF